MNRQYLIITILVLIVLGFGIQAFVNRVGPPGNTPTKTNQPTTPPPLPPPPTSLKPAANPNPAPKLASPVDKPDQRMTKKPFGIYITKANSPVQPEKFSGYHTGTDFETFAEEANIEVPLYAICDGKILQKRTATGYGGVMVQACMIDNQAVTVIYGHVSLKSIAKNARDNLSKGEKIGVLGQPPGETDGERKHLHLGVHKGSGINILGYVQSPSLLSNWLDYQKLH
ncbi:MAG TPA: M23 family metallopeptidase [Patescibacteria group bacterium]